MLAITVHKNIDAVMYIHKQFIGLTKVQRNNVLTDRLREINLFSYSAAVLSATDENAQ